MAFALVGGTARASLVTALPNGTIIPIPRAADGAGLSLNPVTTPDVIAPGVTFTSNVGITWFGFQSSFGFGSNGGWDGMQTPSILIGGNAGTLTISFATAVQGAAAFFNYAPGSNPGTGITIAAYDALGGLIESSDISFATGGANNTGAFYGFSENSASIAQFTMTGSFAGLTRLTADSGTAPVPEPASIALIGTGLIGTALARRRRRR